MTARRGTVYNPLHYSRSTTGAVLKDLADLGGTVLDSYIRSSAFKDGKTDKKVGGKTPMSERYKEWRNKRATTKEVAAMGLKGATGGASAHDAYQAARTERQKEDLANAQKRAEDQAKNSRPNSLCSRSNRG